VIDIHEAHYKALFSSNQGTRKNHHQNYELDGRIAIIFPAIGDGLARYGDFSQTKNCGASLA
jgi:hypothetical protein